jgi:hypothetical protein
LEILEDRRVPAGTLTGLTFLDFNSNGTFDTTATLPNNGSGTVGVAVDQPVAGVTVTAYDAAGNVAGTTTTSAPLGAGNTNWSLALPDGQYRVQFTNLPAGDTSGPQGTDSHTTVQFATVSGNTVSGLSLGLVNPAFYSTDNPTIVTSIFKFGDQINGPNSQMPVLVSLPYTAGAADLDNNAANYTNPAATTLATASQVGTTFGLGYDQQNQTIYAGAYMKKHAGYGPDGNGAIYALSPTTGSITLFADLNAIFGAGTTGTDPHAGNGGNYAIDNGNISWDAVGKTSLGGLDVSPDGKFVYVMNLADRSLYALPTSGPLNSATVRRIQVPLPSDNTVTGSPRTTRWGTCGHSPCRPTAATSTSAPSTAPRARSRTLATRPTTATRRSSWPTSSRPTTTARR